MAVEQSDAFSYQVHQQLGRGATATVWRASDRRGCEVTLKVALDPPGVSALATEAVYAHLALSARLPRLLEVAHRPLGPLPDRAPDTATAAHSYLALEWKPGRTLVVGQQVQARRALVVARDVGEALATLHEVGLAHGDVKPTNIVYDDAHECCALIDLGLAGDADEQQLHGGTPRYLGRGDRKLGTARARDLLALGLVLAELIAPTLAAQPSPLEAARTLEPGGVLGTLLRALLAADPGARPTGRWVSECARMALGDEVGARLPMADTARVRASYLRLRLRELMGSGASAPGSQTAPWLREAYQLVQQARELCWASGAELPAQLAVTGEEAALGPLSDEGRQRWLVSLVGRSALGWPVLGAAQVSEPALAAGLLRLAARKRPELWSPLDVQSALDDTATATLPADGQALAEDLADASVAVRVALAVVGLPAEAAAIELVERSVERAPTALVVATANALRLSNELACARALLLAKGVAGVVLADVLRRAGELAQARQAAEDALAAWPGDVRARAMLARIELDAGNLAQAATLVRTTPTALSAEVAALLAARSGDTAQALRHARRGLALASSAEEHARLHATLAYVSHASDPRAARAGYGEAVAHALRAGAVVEEASYRTGEAAACVELGELSAAIDTARRAALLWQDVLGRPEMAARAWLSRAAALAVVQARYEAVAAATEAIRLARLSRDARAQGYAQLVLADASPASSEAALSAAESAASLLAGNPEDELRAAARLWRTGSSQLDSAAQRALDASCGAAGPVAQLEWWTARAERCLEEGADAATSKTVIEQLVALATSPASVPTLGQAMHAGARLAQRAADSAALERLEAVRARAAQKVLRHCRGQLAEAAGACTWLLRSGGPVAIQDDQALDLQHLVRSLSERANLQTLLDRVLDLLLLWTRAERGLLLLLDDSGELSPRAARNLGRDDLGGDQLEVSRTLARRACEEREPVVAIDAMRELSDSHQSVHALKLRSIMAVPLLTAGEVLGVVYLDDRARRGAFGDKELRWAQAVAPVAALAIADARAQAALREAVARAERVSAQLEENLAEKESALAVAERELARAQGDRPTRFRYDSIIGHGEAMQRVLRIVDRVAPTDVPVMLRGESGSGKELLARALHTNSPRAGRAFVGENCGALPETLLESALFGHVRGAFTGADRAASGLLTAADGGTLFLDEIGEMSLGMQTKLLRVLEDGAVRPVGATRARQVDVRVIAATHRDLDEMVKDGSFREDLYYRLNVVTIEVPPLRERRDDIVVLARHFIAKHAPDRVVRITKAALQTLLAQPWPGNVRQLENEIRRALLMCDGTIDRPHLSLAERAGPLNASAPSDDLDLKRRVDDLERELLTSALERTQGNQTRAAKTLGISRYGLHKMMRRLGMRD